MRLRWLIPLGVILAAILYGTSVDSAPPAPQDDADAPDQRAQLSYGVGFYLGQEVKQGLELDGLTADTDLLVKGFTDGLKGLEPMIPDEQLEQLLFAVHEEMQAQMVKRRLAEDPNFKRLHDENLRRSRAYHKNHAAEEGVVTLSNGIQYRVLASGDGPSPEITDTVIITFRAMHLNGEEYNSGANVEVEVNDVVGGAAAILQMMKVGGKWHVALPPEQAYGAAGDPPLIGPNETIIGEIELLGIK